jgi:hypothetical protein
MQNCLPIPPETVTCYHPNEPSCLIREWSQSYDRFHFRDRHQFFISPSGSIARDSDRSPSPQYDHPS